MADRRRSPQQAVEMRHVYNGAVSSMQAGDGNFGSMSMLGPGLASSAVVCRLHKVQRPCAFAM